MTFSPPSSAPRVPIALGAIEGLRDGTVESFLGIRYAKPPLGALRWRAPQPLEPWPGVHRAVTFGADAMQDPFAEDLAPLRTQPDEDCLFLNVWRPAGAGPDARLPVVVWIHGGGFVNGGSSPAVYQGDAFAQHGVVFVSFNHRLGHLGFFAFPELTRLDADDGLLGNYGLMDQLAALRWVRDHIAAFGGDASNVTLIGESAGGASVIGLMCSPLATGLMHRAIVMSGGGRGLLDGDRRVSQDLPHLPSGETLGLRLARRHGIAGDGTAALAELRRLPASALAKGLQIPTLARNRDVFSGPMLDGRLIVDAPAAIAAGRWARIPVVTGTTTIEVGNLQAATVAAAWASFGDDAAAARAAYAPAGTASLAQINAAIGMDAKMHEPARHLAGAVRAQGLPSYLYRFSYVATPMRQNWPDGAPHASDIPYFLGRLAAACGPDITPADEAMARRAHGLVLNVARHGDPNGPGLPAWRPFEPGCNELFDFASDGAIGMAADALSARLDLTQRRLTR